MYLLSHKYITMKGLSVVKFWEVRPKLPFRFNTTFFTGINAKCDSRLPFCVNNITLPKMEGSASEGSMYLGNTIFTVPVWNIASRKLEITFEETDDMLISQFLGTLMHLTFGRVPYKITVVVTEFEEHMRFDDSTATAYICHLLSFEEPQFKRDGQAGQVTMSATFIVDSVVENWTENSGVVTGARNVAASNEFNPDLNSVYEDYQNEKFTFGNVNFGATAAEANGMLQRQEATKFVDGGKVKATRGNDLGYSNFQVNAAYKVVYDTKSGTMQMIDENGKVLKQAKAFTSNKGKENEKNGCIPKGEYILNNNSNSHNQRSATGGNHAEENQYAMTLYGIEGSAGETLEDSKRAGINLHYGKDSSWSDGCAVTPDTEFMKFVAENVGNSNIIMEVK